MPTRMLQLVLHYDGTGFSGWQRQPDRRTVQGVLEDARLARPHLRAGTARSLNMSRIGEALTDPALDPPVHETGGPAPQHGGTAMTEPTRLTFRRPDDWHVHLRDGDMRDLALAEPAGLIYCPFRALLHLPTWADRRRTFERIASSLARPPAPVLHRPGALR